MATRRWGITVDKDGNIHPSICRAKPGNEGTRGCHHFFHVANKKEAENYVKFMALHKNDAGIVDYSKDVNSLYDGLKTYIINHGGNDKDLPEGSNAPILQSWFRGDAKKASGILSEAQDSNAIPKIKTTKTMRNDIRNLIASGIKVEVTGNRYIGLGTEKSSEMDTDVWMTANEISMKSYDGEAPVSIMVAGGSDEMNAASKVRSKFVEDETIVSKEMHDDFKKAGYVSLIGHRS